MGWGPAAGCFEIGTVVALVTSAIEIALVGEADFARGELEEAQTADPKIDVIWKYVKSLTICPAKQETQKQRQSTLS